MAITWPEALASAPPESPSAIGALVWNMLRQLLGRARARVAGGDRPLQVRDRPAGHGRQAAGAARVPERHDGVAEPDLVRVTGRDGLQPRRPFQPQQRDVLRVVGADHLGGVLAPVGDQLRGHPGRSLDDVVVGQHQAVGGQHHAGALEDLLLVVDEGGDVHEAGLDLVGHGGRSGCLSRPRRRGSPWAWGCPARRPRRTGLPRPSRGARTPRPRRPPRRAPRPRRRPGRGSSARARAAVPRGAARSRPGPSWPSPPGGTAPCNSPGSGGTAGCGCQLCSGCPP